MKRAKLGNFNKDFSNIRERLPALGLAVLLSIGACAQAPEERAHTDPFNVFAAQETYTAAFRHIADKHIKRVTVAALAEEGLRGFQTLDPAFSVVRKGDRVQLLHDGQSVGSYGTPSADDAKAWGKLAARMTLAARSVSDDLRAANTERLYEAVFDGALSPLDIFSRYAGRVEAKKNRGRREGFGGIGIRFKITDKRPVLSRILPGSPAAKAGLKKGDMITHIDGTPLVHGRPRLSLISKQLRGPENSNVVLTVQRGDVLVLNFFLTRAHIVPETVFSKVKDGVMVARIARFNNNTASDLAHDLALYRNALGARLKGVVLDLRGNPGGLLKQSVKVADLFLTQGRVLETRGRHPSSLQAYEAGDDDLSGGLPLVVLIDGKSASASEIVASALQDRGRAVVVGTSSYGKGSVQTVLRLPNDGELTLTWSRFITPSGYTLHGLGVYPTVCTSGDGDVTALLSRATVDSARTALTMASWRRTAFEDKEQRQSLRAVCPAKTHDKKGFTTRDLAVATRLIGQPRTYAQARLLSAEPAAATAELRP